MRAQSHRSVSSDDFAGSTYRLPVFATVSANGHTKKRSSLAMKSLLHAETFLCAGPAPAAPVRMTLVGKKVVADEGMPGRTELFGGVDRRDCVRAGQSVIAPGLRPEMRRTDTSTMETGLITCARTVSGSPVMAQMPDIHPFWDLAVDESPSESVSTVEEPMNIEPAVPAAVACGCPQIAAVGIARSMATDLDLEPAEIRAEELIVVPRNEYRSARAATTRLAHTLGHEVSLCSHHIEIGRRPGKVGAHHSTSVVL